MPQSGKTFLVSEGLKPTHHPKLEKGSPGHHCHLSIHRKPKSSSTPRAMNLRLEFISIIHLEDPFMALAAGGGEGKDQSI